MMPLAENANCTAEPAIKNSKWSSLVTRSIEAWRRISAKNPGPLMPFAMAEVELRTYKSLDDFLRQAGRLLMFWFFQHREAFLS